MLIGPNWVDAVDSKTGQRRLENLNDFVRIEIRKGLARGIPVVPVLVDGAQIPRGPGSGNVFADLGLPEAAAELVKAELTHQLAKRIKTLALTQVAAARRLGVSQPDVSRSMKNRPTGFSTGRPLALLNALDLDIDIDIVLRPASAPQRGAKVRILEECA